MKKIGWIFFLIFVLTLLVRLFLIEKIPGEWYGDISNVHEYESQVLRGEWPFYFFQSPGPLYHYLIAPIVLVFQGKGYETYKISSIIISLIGLIGTFLFTVEISSVALALVTTLTMSFSLWYLIWSRLGNSQIVIPALVAFMSLFIARFVKKKRVLDLLFAAFFASLGWYTYPQTFIFPAIFIVFVVLYLVSYKKIRSHINSLGLVIILMTIWVLPFINIIKADRGNFGPHGYVGEKVLPNLSLPMSQLVSKTLSNYQKVLLMLHVKGDATFRVNVSRNPQLDVVSGIFFLLGFLYFAKRKNQIWLFYILFMLLILPLPSISPAIPDAEIPNAARTIAIIPFIFLLVTGGLSWSFKLLRKIVKNKYLIALIFTIVYVYIAHLNLKLYFVDYTQGLPDNNLAPGRIIANYIDKLPLSTAVYFSSCCWGQWGEPEPKGIVYQLHNERRFTDFTKLKQDCNEIENRPAVVVTDPQKDELVEKFMKCSDESSSIDLFSKEGVLVSKLVLVH